MEFARAGFVTTGIDLDRRKIDAVNQGTSYIPDVETAEVARLVASHALNATTDFGIVAELDTINICVPTPLRKTKDPDMSYIVSAVEKIAAHLRPGMLVILESTTYPGTTEELVRPMLEAGGLKAGIDFFLAFSPERVDPGNPTFNTHNVPKVVGGVGPESTQLASLLYGAAIETIVPVSSPQAAEMVKLLENTFRMVNIGLVNEIALMCDRLGTRRVGGRQGSGDQAVRIHAVLPGTGPGRTLHSDRSFLSLLEGQADRLRSALHRARGADQRRHAPLRSREDRRRAEPASQVSERRHASSSSASPTSGTSTTCASRHRST